MTTSWHGRPGQHGYLRIGHAGAAALEPPNTLRSFQCALDLGVDMVELDVRWTADRQLVVIHGDDLAETTNGSGLVSDHSLAELKALDAGKGERIPTLDDALDLLVGKALIGVDLKQPGYEPKVVRALQDHHAQDDVLMSTLISESLRNVHALASEIMTCISYPEDKGGASRKPYMAPVVRLALALMRAALPWRIEGMIARAQAQGAMLYHKLITPAVVRSLHAQGRMACAWTVDSEPGIARLAAMGVDGIASNRPDLFFMST